METPQESLQEAHAGLMHAGTLRPKGNEYSALGAPPSQRPAEDTAGRKGLTYGEKENERKNEMEFG